jgi:hypothetical protein
LPQTETACALREVRADQVAPFTLGLPAQSLQTAMILLLCHAPWTLDAGAPTRLPGWKVLSTDLSRRALPDPPLSPPGPGTDSLEAVSIWAEWAISRKSLLLV